MTFGSTSSSCAPTPMVRSASISSVTFIVPICAVYAEPERPATMIAVSSGDSSRSIASADEVDDEDVGAEALQLVGALVGDHDAHQERQQAR